MSEQLPTPERHEALPAPEREELLEAHSRTPEKPGAERDPALAAQEARKAVAESNRSDSQLNPLERLEAAENASQPSQSSYINRELKQITLSRELRQIRRQLSAPQRALSRLVHQPAVRVASEAAGRTVSRPSGLLGGGLVALIGTSAYLYLARHIGFEYNYGVWFALLAGGFILGLIIEFGVHVAFRRRSQE